CASAGSGGAAQGGGICYDGGANVSISGTDLSGDRAAGGAGSAGGDATALAADAIAAAGGGGDGGAGQGGALYLASGKNVSLSGDTFTGDQAQGGAGGAGGRATSW